MTAANVNSIVLLCCDVEDGGVGGGRPQQRVQPEMLVGSDRVSSRRLGQIQSHHATSSGSKVHTFRQRGLEATTYIFAGPPIKRPRALRSFPLLRRKRYKGPHLRHASRYEFGRTTARNYRQAGYRFLRVFSAFLSDLIR